MLDIVSRGGYYVKCDMVYKTSGNIVYNFSLGSS